MHPSGKGNDHLPGMLEDGVGFVTHRLYDALMDTEVFMPEEVMTRILVFLSGVRGDEVI